MTQESSWGQGPQTPGVEWSLVEAQCIRIGWGLGWAVGITLVAIGVAAGADVYLTALRAMLALIGFVLLGWTTGIFLSRFALPGGSGGAWPPDSTEIDETAQVGSKVDLTVGDTEPEFPGPGGSGGTGPLTAPGGSGGAWPPDSTEAGGTGELIRSGNAA